MNKYCTRDCKHKPYCKLDEEATKVCKVESPVDGLIMGRTFDEIKRMQQGTRTNKGRKK
jgi:hypothetical protein